MDVLNRKAWICLVEPDRSAVCARRKVNELLEVHSAWRGRRVLGELENEIEDRSDVLGKIGDVFVERAVVDRKETNLVVLQRHELCEVRRADFVEVFCCSVPTRAQDQLNLDEGNLRFDRQDHQKWMEFAGATYVCSACHGLDLL